MLPVADIGNARPGERLRARVTAARRALRGSLCLSTLALACAVAVGQGGVLFAIHGMMPTAPVFAAVAIILASLACLWIGTFAFVRLVTRRAGRLAAAVTTFAFYGLALPFGTGDALLMMVGLVPVALVATPLLARLPWPPLSPRPTLPCA